MGFFNRRMKSDIGKKYEISNPKPKSTSRKVKLVIRKVGNRSPYVTKVRSKRFYKSPVSNSDLLKN